MRRRSTSAHDRIGQAGDSPPLERWTADAIQGGLLARLCRRGCPSPPWVATSPPGGEKASGAGSGNRTHVYWVEASDSAIELCPRERRSAAGARLATDRRSFWFRGSQNGSAREALGLSFDGGVWSVGCGVAKQPLPACMIEVLCRAPADLA